MSVLFSLDVIFVQLTSAVNTYWQSLSEIKLVNDASPLPHL